MKAAGVVAISDDGRPVMNARLMRRAMETASAFGLPVIDGVGAAIKQAEALIALGLSTSKRGAYASPLAKPYRGVLKSFSPGAVAAE